MKGLIELLDEESKYFQYSKQALYKTEIALSPALLEAAPRFWIQESHVSVAQAQWPCGF